MHPGSYERFKVLELTKNDEVIGILGALGFQASIRKQETRVNGKDIWYWNIFVQGANTKIKVNKVTVHKLITAEIIIANDSTNTKYYLIDRMYKAVKQPWSRLYREQRSKEQEHLR